MNNNPSAIVPYFPTDNKEVFCSNYKLKALVLALVLLHFKLLISSFRQLVNTFGALVNIFFMPLLRYAALVNTFGAALHIYTMKVFTINQKVVTCFSSLLNGNIKMSVSRKKAGAAAEPGG